MKEVTHSSDVHNSSPFTQHWMSHLLVNSFHSSNLPHCSHDDLSLLKLLIIFFFHCLHEEFFSYSHTPHSWNVPRSFGINNLTQAENDFLEAPDNDWWLTILEVSKIPRVTWIIFVNYAKYWITFGVSHRGNISFLYIRAALSLRVRDRMGQFFNLNNATIILHIASDDAPSLNDVCFLFLLQCDDNIKFTLGCVDFKAKNIHCSCLQQHGVKEMEQK